MSPCSEIQLQFVINFKYTNDQVDENTSVCLYVSLLCNQSCSNFHPLEVVGHGSEKQLHVDRNLKYLNHFGVLTIVNLFCF